MLNLWWFFIISDVNNSDIVISMTILVVGVEFMVVVCNFCDSSDYVEILVMDSMVGS